MAKYKTNNKAAVNEISMPNIIVGVWVVLMFSLFPLVFNNYYYNILETKYTTFCIITAAMLLSLLIWGFISNRAFLYWEEVKKQYGEEGHWFKHWFKATFSLLDRCIMIFIVIAAISTIAASPYISQAFIGNEGRFTGLFLLMLYTSAYFCVSRFFKFNKGYISVFLWVGLFICYFGITDYFNMDIMGFKVRMKATQMSMFTSTIGNINTYTTYVGFVVALAGTLFITSKEWKGRRLLYLLCLEVAFLALTTGNSDNGYLTLAAFFGFLPLAVFATRRGIRRYISVMAIYATNIKLLEWINIKYAGTVNGIDGLYTVLIKFPYINLVIITLWALTAILYIVDYKTGASESDAPKVLRYIWGGIIIIIVIAVVGLLYAANANGDILQGKLGSLSNYLVFSDGWGTYRGYIWRACIEEYTKLPLIHKIFGTGPDTFGIYMVNLRYDDMVRATHQVYDSAHNEYLQYLFTVGPIALIAYVVLLISTIKRTIIKGLSDVKITHDSVEPYMIAFAYVILCYAAQASVNINLPISTPILWVFMMLTANYLRDKKF